MRRLLYLTALTLAAPAAAQPALPPASAGIRLDVVASAEVNRTPDQVTISTGVVTRAVQAEAALRDNATRLARVRAALGRAGIQPRDIQTGSISLSQDFRADQAGGDPRPIGYVASNQLSVRFRDVGRAGAIIDALVAEGATNINGPAFSLANAEAAQDEARTRALVAARSRAELYARALGTRVRRIVAVSEAGGVTGPQPYALVRLEAAQDTQIEPGQIQIGASVTVTFELDQPQG